MTATSNGSIPWTFVLNEPVRILIIDDDPILCEFASVFLSSPCASIEIACGAAAARLALSQNTYDLLLLDIEMPDVDGFALLADIRATNKDLPVIMLTGHDDITSIDRAYQIGASSFATKPVNWRQLSYQIRQIVRTTRAHGAPPVAPHDDVQAALQIVIDRANPLKQRLAADDDDRSAELLREIRSFAGLCQTLRPGPEFRGDSAHQ